MLASNASPIFRILAFAHVANAQGFSIRNIEPGHLRATRAELSCDVTLRSDGKLHLHGKDGPAVFSALC
jgi:hypothetical protein